MRVISIDTESYYDDEVSVKPLGYRKYARHPKAEVYMVSVSDGTEVWAGHPRDFNEQSLCGATLITPNKAHDYELAAAAKERTGASFVPDEFLPGGARCFDWHCVSNMASYLLNVRSLAEMMRLGCGINVDKGTRDRAKGKTWDDMVKEGWGEEMIKYAQLDAINPIIFWNKYEYQWPAIERWLSNITIEQGRRGLRIDRAALEEGIRLMQRVIIAATDNLPWVKRGRAPASPIGIAEECRVHGIPPPPVKAHNPDAAEEWEEAFAPKFPFVYALKNIRKAKKTLATLETIQQRLCDDDTVAFSLKYCGAHTRRWAGDAGWNLQNQNKEPLFVGKDSGFVLGRAEIKRLAELFRIEQRNDRNTADPHFEQSKAFGTLSDGTTFFDMRGIVIAPPGKLLCPVDLSQIEPRVLNWIAKNFEFLAKIAGGMAIYEAHARDTMGWTGGRLKDENPKLYALAKARVLGLGYGCGWEKFITLAAKDGIDLTEGDEEFAKQAAMDGKIYLRIKHPTKRTWHYTALPDGLEAPRVDWEVQSTDQKEECYFVTREGRDGPTVRVWSVYGARSRAIVNDFREKNPLITGLWRQMEDELRAAVGRDLEIELPNGDKLVYRNVKKETRATVDEETGERGSKTVYTAEVGGKRYIFYGGLIVENIVQAIARHVFAFGMKNVIDAGHWVQFHVHDEGVPEVERTVKRKDIEALMSVVPEWLPGCPIAAEAKLTFRYLK